MEGAAVEGKRKKTALRAEGGVGGLALRHGAIAAAAAVGVALVAVAATRNRKKKKAQRPSKDEDGGTDAPGGAGEETAMGEEREPRSLPLVSQGSPPSRPPLPPPAENHLPRSKDEHPPDYPTPEKIIEEERGRQVGEEEELADLPKTIEVVEEALEEIPSAEEEEETEISPEEAVKASWPPAEIAAVQEETSTKKSGGSGLVAILVSWKNSRNLLFWLSLFFVAVAATLLYEFNLHLPQSSPL
ncbi:unnamed protein product [Spirodela intermedia]|uniref:Uncharacterized protein n=2 Tax=Spirodela intermedia TaxID=51605 RepID=A0A7I8L859_SPIIN|nr:unnamed protein product [Spirodela intermedia]CAA6669120.1 unnamed protein product [Spirodela intermedia]CAA7406070.1 unnamed protein product [Spirodela intermedia]